ncbi:protein PBDC1-like [Anneissia japonica]|uniref:protein PBDC1-like n=1 Tax=Anneissia japonica TaxID=1529436 RepID=UPI00142554D2|nr:protein PBDC1-like [Anneissia japonica]
MRMRMNRRFRFTRINSPGGKLSLLYYLFFQGAGGALAVQNALSQPADKYVNDSSLEMQWAMKAFKHAEVYYNLISSVDSRSLKLTKHDDEILEHFKKDFPDFNIQKFDEDDLKTESAKFVS